MEGPLFNDNQKLDLLPTEVLHRIASFLPCSSILSLCFTNGRLYAACYDTIVFKHSAIRTIHEDRYTNLLELNNCDCQNCSWRKIDLLDQQSWASETTTEVDSEDEWYPEPVEDAAEEDEWDYNDWGPDEIQRRALPQQEWLLNWPGSSVFTGLSALNSARIAYAVERAQRNFNVSLKYQTRDLSPQWTKGRWIEWLPQLMALGHMSCLDLKPWTLQKLLFEPDSNWENHKEWPKRNPCSLEYMSVGFCMLMLMLVWMETKPRIAAGSTDHQEELSEQFCLPEPNAYYVWEQMNWLLMDTSNIRNFNLDDRYSVILRLLFQIWYYQRSDSTPFPSIHRLPLAATVGSPIPFRTSADVIAKCRLSELQLADYLPGKWLGWCKDLGTFEGHEIPPPFEDIHFTIRKPHPPYAADIVALVSSATGKDGWGPFTMEGTVSTDGEVWLRRLYAQHLRGNPYSHTGATWRYRGAITTFGITGVFEEDNGVHQPTGRLRRTREGFFWLWKKDWCHDWP